MEHPRYEYNTEPMSKEASLLSPFLGRVRESGDVVLFKRFPVKATASIDDFLEIKLLQNLSHPSIPTVVDVYLEDHVSEEVGKCLCTVINSGHGLTIEQSTLSDVEAQQILHSILDALRHAHSGNIVHRNICPESIFLRDNGDILLINFLIGQHSNFPESSLPYASPEILRNDLVTRMDAISATERGTVDIWALGATVLEKTIGVQLIPRADVGSGADFLRNGYIDHIDQEGHLVREYWSLEAAVRRAGDDAMEKWRGLSASLQHTLTRCLQHDHTKRASADELLRDEKGVTVAPLGGVPLENSVFDSNAPSEGSTAKGSAEQTELEALREELALARLARDEAEVLAVVAQRMAVEARASLAQQVQSRPELTGSVCDSNVLPSPPTSNAGGGGAGGVGGGGGGAAVKTGAAHNGGNGVPLGQGPSTHHPGAFWTDHWDCCLSSDRGAPGCRRGPVRHHRHYDADYARAWACCNVYDRGTPGCKPGPHPRPFPSDPDPCSDLK